MIPQLFIMDANFSERNNTDLVGVTWPGAGGQMSRVGRGQYLHTVGQIAISASGGPVRGRRDPLWRLRMTVARQTMAVYAIASVAGQEIL
ncbi:hypothetical protein T06_891 [Trichinella sp. T6]|nr:hypothetical protein T06_891 [Trichinella sp. T6]